MVQKHSWFNSPIWNFQHWLLPIAKKIRFLEVLQLFNMARLSPEKIWFQSWAKIREEKCFCKPKCSFLSEFVSEFSHCTAMTCGCHSKTSVAQCTEEGFASSEDTHPLPFPACCRTAIPHRLTWCTGSLYGGSHYSKETLKAPRHTWSPLVKAS